MNRLARLRSRLARLRRRRRLTRLMMGYAALGIAVLWALLAAFLGDWLMDMSRAQRVVAILVAAAAAIWAFRRFTRPWLGRGESLTDMALLVERREHIDSDLVAALQFESPEAPGWGSVQLEQAVIEQAAHLGEQVHATVDIPPGRVTRRVVALALTLAVVALGAWWFPDYVRTFLVRLLLGSTRYPTHTAIEAARVNGRELDLAQWGLEDFKCPYGQPLRVEVLCSGRIPAAGRAQLTTEKSGLAVAFALEPGDQRGEYSGQWPRLVDAARLELFLGDARTDPLRLVVVPPPTVDAQFEVTPPAYAAPPGAGPEVVTALRQLAVPEGSRVVVRIASDKELQQADLSIEGSKLPMTRVATQAAPGDRDVWTMDPAGTPLAAVAEPVRYAIQVTDVDGLSLERPIEGVIRVKIDRPPEVTASALTTLVLPTARPTISYTATDDYGIGEVTVLAEVIHSDGTAGEKTQLRLYALPPGSPPRKNIQDRQRVALAPLKAVKGDQVKVTARAVDDRGGAAGKAATSEPLMFQVTDEQGIYAAMAEADRESAKRLQTMIDNQMDVGERK